MYGLHINVVGPLTTPSFAAGYRKQLFAPLLLRSPTPFFSSLSLSPTTMSAQPAKGKALEGEGEAPKSHKIRITLTSQTVESLEKGE